MRDLLGMESPVKCWRQWNSLWHKASDEPQAR
jgi:hypothetical protein